MEQQDYDQIMVKAVSKACEQLTDAELNSIYMVALLGSNPKHVRGYDKVESLFTEDDGTRMHPTTREALAAVWQERCGKSDEGQAG